MKHVWIELNYIFATRGLRVLCIQFTRNAALDLINHLRERNYTIESATKEQYQDIKEGRGSRIQTYYVNALTVLNF